MRKVTINGEVHSFDDADMPLDEAILVEQTYGQPHGQWQADMGRGSALALAVYIWLVWRRNGKDVEFADILSGKEKVDLLNLKIEAEGNGEGLPDPTGDPEASPPTGTST